jgi:hypothetical protein
LLTNANSLLREIDELSDGVVQPADESQQESSEAGEGIAVAREEPEIGPGIEVMLKGEQTNVQRTAAMAEFCAIGVLLPPNAAQQCTIARAKRDQVTAAAMVRPQHQAFGLKLRKGSRDIARTKTRAVAADRNDFVIAKLMDSLDGILQPFGKAAAVLLMDAGFRRRSGNATGREEVNVDVCEEFGVERRKLEQTAGGRGERTPGQIDLFRAREDQNGAAHGRVGRRARFSLRFVGGVHLIGQLFGYEIRNSRHKPFYRKVER